MRAVVTLFVSLLTSLCYPKDWFPDSYLATSDDDQVAQAAADAVKDHGCLRLDSREWAFSKNLVLIPADGEDVVSIKIVGKTLWRGVTWKGKGPWLTMVDPKDCVIESVGVNVLDPEGSGWEFQAKGSAGRSSLRQCYVQGGQVAYLWKETSPGAGSDNWIVEQCQSNDAKVGFKVVGPNSLSPWLFNMCAATGAQIGFDLREGGAGVWMTQCGGSDTDVVFWINGGYLGKCVGAETERARVAFRIGGDGAAGYGQTSPYLFQATDLRDTKEAQAEVFKAGDVTLDIQNVKGTNRLVRVKNENQASPLTITSVGFKGLAVRNLGVGQVKTTGFMVATLVR